MSWNQYTTQKARQLKQFLWQETEWSFFLFFLMQTLYNIEIGTLQTHIYSEKHLVYDFLTDNSDYSHQVCLGKGCLAIYD